MENINIETLIQLVKLKPCLFNRADKNYKDVVRKTNIWCEIGGSLNSTGELCDKVWKNLRDKYKRERKKIINKPSGSGDFDISTWVWFDDLRFLDDFLQQRRRIPTKEKLTYSVLVETTAKKRNEEQARSQAEEVLNIRATPSTSGSLKDAETPAKKRKTEVLQKKRGNVEESIDDAILNTLNAIHN